MENILGMLCSDWIR